MLFFVECISTILVGECFDIDAILWLTWIGMF